MSGRALITGAAGFVGQALAAHLTSEGVDVHGVELATCPRPATWAGGWHQADVTDAPGIRAVLEAVRPDFVFHLAALLRGQPLETLLAVNAVGTGNVLEAVAALRTPCRVLVAGSAAEYGLARAEELPIREENPLRPVSAYGISKVAQSVLAASYAHSRGVAVIRTRTFNLTGPSEPDSLVCSGIARRIVEIERGAPPTLTVRGLDSRRDFVDVRDAVVAYWLLAQRGTSGEVYNVCSGTGTPISRVVEVMRGMSKASITVVASPDAEPADVPFQTGSPEKSFSSVGWRAGIPLEQSLADLLRTRRTASERADDRRVELHG